MHALKALTLSPSEQHWTIYSVIAFYMGRTTEWQTARIALCAPLWLGLAAFILHWESSTFCTENHPHSALLRPAAHKYLIATLCIIGKKKQGSPVVTFSTGINLSRSLIAECRDIHLATGERRSCKTWPSQRNWALLKKQAISNLLQKCFSFHVRECLVPRTRESPTGQYRQICETRLRHCYFKINVILYRRLVLPSGLFLPGLL